MLVGWDLASYFQVMPRSQTSHGEFGTVAWDTVSVPDRSATAAPKVFVGDLTSEELDEIGPDATPQQAAPESWTRDEYRAWMLQSGIIEVEGGLGIESFLDLAESVGLLEKRPNTAILEPVSKATIALCRVVPLLGDRGSGPS
ncbi:hypothetical protein GCM10010486_20760 [Nonomuraea roseoviolacea subsp. carminata]